MYRTNWLSGLAVGFVVAGCTATESGPATDTAVVRQELTDQMAAYAEAVLSGDAEQMIGFWTEDGHFLEPGINRSGNELRDYIREGIGTGQVQVVSWDLRAYDHFIHGDVAYEIGEYDLTVEVDGQEQMVRNYYFMRWEKGTDGVWRFDRFVAGPREAPSGM